MSFCRNCAGSLTDTSTVRGFLHSSSHSSSLLFEKVLHLTCHVIFTIALSQRVRCVSLAANSTYLCAVDRILECGLVQCSAKNLANLTETTASLLIRLKRNLEANCTYRHCRRRNEKRRLKIACGPYMSICTCGELKDGRNLRVE